MDVRRKIVQSAYRLFAEKGYEKTTISDIVKDSGASKGGFYHHFSSKMDILKVIVDDYYEDLDRYFDRLFCKDDPIAQFNGVFKAVNDYKRSLMSRWPEIIKVFSFEGNELFHMKSALIFEKMITKYYTKIIELGVEEGAFETNQPLFVGELLSKELLKIYTRINYLIYTYSEELFKEFVDMLDFEEELFRHLLKSEKISLKDEALTYVWLAKEKYDELKTTN